MNRTISINDFYQVIQAAKQRCVDAAKKAEFSDLKEDFLRPFVSNGDPTDCRVLIVGFNPANTLKIFKDGVETPIPWCHHWKPEKGYCLAEFYADYIKGRKGMRGTDISSVSERMRRVGLSGKISQTRAAIECVSDQLEKNGIMTLETNLYWHPTPKASDLPAAFRKEEGGAAFMSLVRNLNTLVVLCHGRATEDFVAEKQRAGEFECSSIIYMSKWRPDDDDEWTSRSHLRRFPYKANQQGERTYIKNLVKDIVTQIER
jgi:hypothetical protein